MQKFDEITESVDPRVKLISYSQPSKEFLAESGMHTLEELVAYAARVSNPSNQHNKETASKLIKYLIKHKHWSPLEMVSATLEIRTTRDIARQILRHRSFSFQEFSQRYADPTEELSYEIREARLQDANNRQNSLETDDLSLIQKWDIQQQSVIDTVNKAYRWAIKNGVAKEQARCVLPEGMIASRMYMAGTLRSWIHYIELRTGMETQKEHREIAGLCAKELSKLFPADILMYRQEI